jgi:uracil-DNA glycosylase
VPPTLANIHRELRNDTGLPIPSHGNLEAWARRGVLLLNATLTVREGESRSHYGMGWETFTNEVIRLVAAKSERVVFLLWGAEARRKKALIVSTHHLVIESSHPSPRSAYRGFLGSRPFSRTNRALFDAGRKGIDWRLPG